MTKTIDVLVKEILTGKTLLSAVLSAPHIKDSTQKTKLVIRPVMIKNHLQYQITEYQGTQTFHRNVDAAECLRVMMEYIGHYFSQALICTTQVDYHVLANKKGKITILSKPPTKSKLNLEHNRKKQYIMEEGDSNPFLIELGIMNVQGKVVPKRSDKFRQLNRFLEMLQDILPKLDKQKKIKVIDFGCGKAYLTFALYHYLHDLLGYDLDVVGLDLKQEVITHCQELAEKLGYAGLKFQVGDINTFSPAGNVDMMISLHACDTATDAALEKAIRWQASVILCVPCCQHELYEQVSNEALTPILQHGILKERFAALATDAARAQLLEILGYQCQVLEFIDLEHTPKNLLIRAVRKTLNVTPQHALDEYQNFKKALNITPSLECRFRQELEKMREKMNNLEK
jgi:SAM-dependent methyltransferase